MINIIPKFVFMILRELSFNTILKYEVYEYLVFNINN